MLRAIAEAKTELDANVDALRHSQEHLQLSTAHDLEAERLRAAEGMHEFVVDWGHKINDVAAKTDEVQQRVEAQLDVTGAKLHDVVAALDAEVRPAVRASTETIELVSLEIRELRPRVLDVVEGSRRLEEQLDAVRTHSAAEQRLLQDSVESIVRQQTQLRSDRDEQLLLINQSQEMVIHLKREMQRLCTLLRDLVDKACDSAQLQEAMIRRLQVLNDSPSSPGRMARETFSEVKRMMESRRPMDSAERLVKMSEIAAVEQHVSKDGLAPP